MIFIRKNKKRKKKRKARLKKEKTQQQKRRKHLNPRSNRFKLSNFFIFLVF